jgi:CBS domain-containing protein
VNGKHQDHRIRNLLVKDIMSAPLVSVDRNAPVAAVIGIMLKKNISSMPIMEKGRVIGIVTRDSLVKAL